MVKRILLALAVFAVALPTYAAVNVENFGFTVNGQSSDEVRAGSSYKLGFTVDVDGGDEVEYFRVRHINENGDIVNSQCFKVDPRLANVDDAQVFQQVKTPSDLPAGDLDQELDTFGIPGLQQSTPCDENNQNGGNNFANRLIITHTSDVDDADTTVGNGNGNVDEEEESLVSAIGNAISSAFEAMFKKYFGSTTPTTPTTPVKPAYCASMVVYTGLGGYTGNATAVQSWLLSTPHKTYFHDAGVYSPTGYWGGVSATAYAAATTACK